MACSGCSPLGCGNKGHCSTGSCNKMNTYDWINTLDLYDPSEYRFVEVSFKNGAHKDFYHNPPNTNTHTKDLVLVETGAGYDIGTISLSGELVRMQLKKKQITEDRIVHNIIRKANDRDLEKLTEARNLEKETLIRARAMAQTLGLEMKLGDVQYQADLKKATFYYTANGRVDFRELVRVYAKEFKVKIEMRQIGSRQESARIGGIGSCGRELCCSTWLSDFRSVNTAAARYQNIAINQTKLSGQCGRLKCCLNYELDTYMDALRHFPVKADYIMTKKGKAVLMKTDIFKGLMYYAYDDITMRGVFHPLDKERVKEILEMNHKGIHPEDLNSFVEAKPQDLESAIGYADVTGEIELPENKKNKKKKNRDNRDRQNQHRPNRQADATLQNGSNPQSNAPQKDDDVVLPKNNPPQNQNLNEGQNQKGNDRSKKPLKKPFPPRQSETDQTENRQAQNNNNRVEKKQFHQKPGNLQKAKGDNPPQLEKKQFPPTSQVSDASENATEGKKPFKKKKFNKFKNRNNNNQNPPSAS